MKNRTISALLGTTYLAIALAALGAGLVHAGATDGQPIAYDLKG
jgi:hypothetical protein